MKKGTLFTMFTFATLGAFAYVINDFIKNDEFSEDTIDQYYNMIKNAKSVGSDVKRTYTSLGDKNKFKKSTKALGANTKKLYSSGLSLVKGAGSDIYTHFADKFSQVEENNKKKINKSISKDTKKSTKTKNSKQKK